MSAHPSAERAVGRRQGREEAHCTGRGRAPAFPLTAQWAQRGLCTSHPMMDVSIHTPVTSILPGVRRRARVPNSQGPPV